MHVQREKFDFLSRYIFGAATFGPHFPGDVGT